MARTPFLRWTAHSGHGRAFVVRPGVLRERAGDWTACSAADELSSLVGTYDPETGKVIAERDGDAILVSADWIAALDEGQAASFGLPPTTRLGVQLRSVGTQSDPNFRINLDYRTAGGVPERRRRQGAFLERGSTLERLPAPLYDLVLATERLEKPIEDRTERLVALQAVTAAAERVGLDVSTDAFLRDLRVFVATAISLRLPDPNDIGTFEPVLFGRAEQEREGDAPADETEHALLTGGDDSSFQRAFRRDGGQATVSLGNGRFVYLTEPVRAALRVVADRRAAPPEERRAFALAPERHLKEALASTADEEDAVERVFVATEQFSARVEGIGEWVPPVLPWIIPRQNSWLPDKFGLRVGGASVEVSPERADGLEQSVRDAIEAGCAEVEIEGQAFPATEATAMAARDVERAAAAVRDTAPAEADGADQADPDDPALPQAAALFLRTRENFEQVTFGGEPEGKAAPDFAPATTPGSLTARLKTHQVEGFQWLTSAAQQGLRGVLLADDMGLGKTLQALTFLAWQRETALREGRMPLPSLIVAPTALQQGWRNEMEQHFEPSAFGRVERITGTKLRSLYQNGGNGSRLDLAPLKACGVLITTYETLRDHHVKLATLPVSTVIFDEVQKAKNPASRLTAAAKTVNARFVLSLTGTPVENKLQDLWSIMDLTYPGRLGSSKDFAATYDETSEADLARLNAVMTSADGGAPLMLRRMKSDAISDLPSKMVVVRRRVMPKPQADAYTMVLEAARGSNGRKDMLRALQGWRSASLHPDQAPAFDPHEIDAVIGRSARFVEGFAALDEAHAAGAKVLVFLEALAWQDWLVRAIRVRYGLAAKVPLINGSTAPLARQRIVDAFQTAPNGFAALVLSPKAAGVGLTITAASHVIHLSRWWNPAVEDQATDRAYRIGQTKDVTVHIPLAEHPSFGDGSFDTKLDHLMTAKRKMGADFLAPTDLSESDIFDAVLNV